jgi:type I restriction-modification system DNA methylase subunit
MTDLDDRIKSRGEVFTPSTLVNEMLDKLPPEVWDSPTKTWLDNSAGSGNFLVEVKSRLLKQHPEVTILEDQIFAVEINVDSVLLLQERLGYTINGVPNPILSSSHFTEDELDEECLKFCPDHTGTTYLHHRNIVCGNGLTYDYDFGRTKKLLEF